MSENSWSHNKTAPVLIKILAWLAVVATLFFVVHAIILVVFAETIEPQAWVQEFYLHIFSGLPLFLLLIGSMICERKYRILLWSFLGIFLVGHFINILNTYEILDVGGLQYPMCIALLGLFITYLFHLFNKKKVLNDFFKLSWFTCLAWVYIAPRFIQSGHKAGWFLLAAQIIFPIMMTVGLFTFFKKQNK